MFGFILAPLGGNLLAGMGRDQSADPALVRPPVAAAGWRSQGRRIGPDPDASRGSLLAGEGRNDG